MCPTLYCKYSTAENTPDNLQNIDRVCPTLYCQYSTEENTPDNLQNKDRKSVSHAIDTAENTRAKVRNSDLNTKRNTLTKF